MKLSILSAAILISISAGKAFGCVCVLDPNPTPEKIRADRLKAFENASAVFTGEVVSLDLLKVKFKVNKIWKGEASPEITILTGTRNNGDGTFTSNSCDYSFTQGQQYLVYAYGSPGEMKTHECSRTALIKYAEKEMQGLDEIRPPVKMNDEPVPDSSDLLTTHKVTITFTGSVKSIDVFGDRELKVVPIDLDSRFAVTIHIESVTPKEVPLKIDTDQNFAVHSPAQLFHDEKENIIGRKYRFKVVWNGMRTNPIFSQLSAVPMVDEAAQRKVSFNGLSFAYVEQGSGATVILVHGSISDYREWAQQMSPLARRYRVIAYSRRYHWPNSSPGADADVRVEVQADDLAAIIRALGVAPAHIVGHSFGGAIALNLTLRHPELVRTLVLAEPAVSGVLGNISENDPVMKDSQAVRAEMKEAFETGDAEKIVRTYAARVAPGEFEKASPDVRQMLLTNVPAFRLDFTSRRPPFTCDDAGRVTVPVLVVSGGRSALGLQRIAASAARCIKGAKLVTLPDATHWLQHDQAQAFNDAVLAFLAGTGK